MAISEEQLKRLAEQLPDVSRDPQRPFGVVRAIETDQNLVEHDDPLSKVMPQYKPVCGAAC